MRWCGISVRTSFPVGSVRRWSRTTRLAIRPNAPRSLSWSWTRCSKPQKRQQSSNSTRPVRTARFSAAPSSRGESGCAINTRRSTSPPSRSRGSTSSTMRAIRQAPSRSRRISSKGVWQPSLDTYLPVQMDHVKVRENYRVWHGVSHMDDARQAPVNYTHFDGYSMGASSDSPFATGEHIPGLNRGGWYDAGDYDIRTQTQALVITDLAIAREVFHLDWDETSVDEDARLVQIHRPDGIPDVLQQIRHGVLGLLAQYSAFGHAIPGIVEPTLEEYTHL